MSAKKLTPVEKVAKATLSLKAALAEAGIGEFQIRLLDWEDANKLIDIMGERKPIHAPVGFQVHSYGSAIGEVRVYWRNIGVSETKDPNYHEKKAKERREREIRQEAERVGESARRAVLERAGIV
ncbi:hypothetical protein [Methylorubrum extorquens]|uniref:hypothetical protein n=1 Tax=Methylorubrum extorquens TaxID=408 RepID=UPI0020A21766|nr:hypothetical protein [Methylorubrum extorquens]MCP1540101.1 hypothetical protein [Methylorubrum extorquens]